MKTISSLSWTPSRGCAHLPRQQSCVLGGGQCSHSGLFPSSSARPHSCTSPQLIKRLSSLVQERPPPAGIHVRPAGATGPNPQLLSPRVPRATSSVPASVCPWAEWNPDTTTFQSQTAPVNCRNEEWVPPATEKRKSPVRGHDLIWVKRHLLAQEGRIWGSCGRSGVCFLLSGGISPSSKQPPGPALEDVENEFHSDFHGARALKQLQEGTQLALPSPHLVELLWRNATLPMESERSYLLLSRGHVKVPLS